MKDTVLEYTVRKDTVLEHTVWKHTVLEYTVESSLWEHSPGRGAAGA